MTTRSGEGFKDTSYELFILALSILSLVNWVLSFVVDDPDATQVLLIVDLLLSLIFIADFLFRLFTAESKSLYFLRQYGWLDLFSSLPFPQAKIARLGRVSRMIRLIRQYGGRRLIREVLDNRAGVAMYAVGFLIILVLEFGSITILIAEAASPNANIQTAGDALWWSLVTVSTVGYGDRFPVTIAGRFIGILVIIVGVALFGVLTGFLSNRFVVPQSEGPGAPDQLASAPADTRAILEAITSLQIEQERANTEFGAKLADLLERLDEASQ